jgi:hypothetical protein
MLMVWMIKHHDYGPLTISHRPKISLIFKFNPHIKLFHIKVHIDAHFTKFARLY